MRKLLAPLLLAVVLPSMAQISSTPEPMRANPAVSAVQPPPAAGVASSLPRLNQLVANTRVNLAALRIEKWKTNSGNKNQLQANVDSLERNMTAALPAIMQEVRAKPASLGAAFKLYRNVSALYDVMFAVSQAAGVFAPDEDYRALATDTNNLDSLRRSMADQIEAMATARDAELAQLQVRGRQAGTAAETEPAKKIVIDDTEMGKKPAKRKPRSTTKKPATEKQATPPK